jgi:hypothetical protein
MLATVRLYMPLKTRTGRFRSYHRILSILLSPFSVVSAHSGILCFVNLHAVLQPQEMNLVIRV